MICQSESTIATHLLSVFISPTNQLAAIIHPVDKAINGVIGNGTHITQTREGQLYTGNVITVIWHCSTNLMLMTQYEELAWSCASTHSEPIKMK
jgi:hypothetical protein